MPQTASAHLAKLADMGVLAPEKQRCHRDYAFGRAHAMLLGVDAFRLVPISALQVAACPGAARRADCAQAGARQAPRHGMSLRGFLRGFGLKVGPTTPRSFEGRIRELVDGYVTLMAVADALLLARSALGEQLGKLQKRLVSLARNDTRARLLMTTPGVGMLVVALTYVAAIDDPGRFESSKATGQR
jgi:hypothetical protein